MLPKINQVLHINQLSTNEEESRKEYKSRIADLTEFYIAMEVPLDEETGKLKRLQPGEELSVYYTSEAGVKNCFNTSVIGIKDDVIRQVLIQKTGSRIHYQNSKTQLSESPVAIGDSGAVWQPYSFCVAHGGCRRRRPFFCLRRHIPLMVQFQLSCWLLVSYKKNGSIEHIPFKLDRQDQSSGNRQAAGYAQFR